MLPNSMGSVWVGSYCLLLFYPQLKHFWGYWGQCELPRLMRYFGEDMITQDCPERWMHPRNNYSCLKKKLWDSLLMVASTCKWS